MCNLSLRLAMLLLLVALPSCERPDSETGPRASASAVRPGMCAEHGVPEAVCTKCNPALAKVFKAKGDWCEEHGFPESFCPVCNPNAAFPDVGGAPAAQDWCGGHALPESQCTKCSPSLIPKYKAKGDWCEEHGFPESVCPVCNPQSPPGGDAAVVDWCSEHRLPESRCTKCNTELKAQYLKSGDWCEEHGFPESVCPVCNPQPVPAGAPGSGSIAPGTKIRFRSAETEKTVGIETVAARKAAMGSGVVCTARIDYNRNQLADIRALVPGIVRKLSADLGQEVKRGAPLFVLESTKVGELQAALSGLEQRAKTAQVNADRKQELFEGGITSQRSVEVAKQDLATARADLTSAQSALQLAGAPQAGAGRYVLSAPLSGTLVRRPGVVGAYATAETSLATVADTSTMWARFDVPEASAADVKTGQWVSVVVEGANELRVRGKITWIAAEVDPKTRMVEARAEIPNKAGTVRANQFARAVIESSPSESAVVVPRSALQRFGESTVVFVRLGAGLYEPRVVETGVGDAKEVQVSEVKPDEQVVTTGAYVLKTELSPESIGAGCCEIEEPEAG